VVYEPVCHGLEHVPFNCGILSAALELANGCVTFVAEESHLALVREASSHEVRQAVDWQQVVIAPRRLAGFRARLPYESRLLSQVWEIAGKRSATALVGTGVTEPGLLALKLKLWSSPSTRPVGVVFHGVLSCFLYSRKRRFYLRAATPRRLRYLLLGETIRNEVVKLVPQIAPNAFVLPHPLATGLCSGPLDLDPARLVFGFLGLGSEEKGFPLFLRMARELAGDPPSLAQFEAIGPYPDAYRSEVHGLLDSAGGRFRASRDTNVAIPMEGYHARLRELAYVVLPYSIEAYRFTCSGAALDAVTAAKPMIALRTAQIEDLFARMGDIGYLCSDYAEMLRTVRKIAADPPRARYHRQRDNLVRGRELFGTGAVARQLAAALAAN